MQVIILNPHNVKAIVFEANGGKYTEEILVDGISQIVYPALPSDATIQIIPADETAFHLDLRIFYGTANQ